MRFILICFLVLCNLYVLAQEDRYRFIQTNGPGFIKDGDTTLLGFFGGMKSPLMANLDINNDGIQDIIINDVIEDRTQVVLVNIKDGEIVYQLGNEWLESLPSLDAFFTILDIDGDGNKDIITGNTNLRVYKGLGFSDGKLNFEIWEQELEYKNGNAVYSINIQVGDSPALADIDGDGDIDILAFNEVGDRVRYFRNESLSNDSLYFVLKSECWGSFEEASTNSDILIGQSCVSRVLNKKQKHPGAKLTALDFDGDGDLELLVSDVNTSNIVMLKNGRVEFNHPIDTIITVETEWPSASNAVDVTNFPILSILDVNADGKMDIVATATSYTPVSHNLVWLYENRSSEGYDLKLSSKSFLIDQMIDIGRDAIPAVVDYDADGDLDLLISGMYHKDGEPFKSLEASLSLFENKDGYYVLVDDDYLGFKGKDAFFLAPSFGDIDNDGDVDLIIGNYNGTIDVYSNSAGANQPINLSLSSTKYLDIDVGSQARPCIFDVNKDGKTDIIIGEYDGNLNCYLAKGSSFELYSENWGNIKTNGFYWDYVYDENRKIIDSTKYYLPAGDAHPTIADGDGDGKLDILVGSSWGFLYFYNNVSYDEKEFKQVEKYLQNDFINNQIAKNLGSYICPVFTNLNNDDQLDVFVGLSTGGIQALLGAQVAVGFDEPVKQSTIQVFPKPNAGSFVIKSSQNSPQVVSLYTISGTLLSSFILQANATYNVNQLNYKGMLLVVCQGDNYKTVDKVIVH